MLKPWYVWTVDARRVERMEMALAGNCSICQKLLRLKLYEDETSDSVPGLYRLIKAADL